MIDIRIFINFTPVSDTAPWFAVPRPGDVFIGDVQGKAIRLAVNNIVHNTVSKPPCVEIHCKRVSS